MDQLSKREEVIQKWDRARVLWELLMQVVGADYTMKSNEVLMKMKECHDAYHAEMEELDASLKMAVNKKSSFTKTRKSKTDPNV